MKKFIALSLVFILCTVTMGCAAGAKDPYILIGTEQNRVAEVGADSVDASVDVIDGAKLRIEGQHFDFNLLALIGLVKEQAELVRSLFVPSGLESYEVGANLSGTPVPDGG